MHPHSTDPLPTASGVDLSSQLRFTRHQYALLAVLVALIAGIAAVGYRSGVQVTADTEAMTAQMEFVGGNAVSLEREALTHALVVERWADGRATYADIELSSALLERQRRIFSDEILDDPDLAAAFDQLTSSLDSINELSADGPPEASSAEEAELRIAVDGLMMAAKQFYDLTEGTNFDLIRRLEDGLRKSRRTEVVVACMILGLMLTLVLSVRRMLKSNYHAASTALQGEQGRYEEARADRVYAEEKLRQAQKLESVGQLAAGIAHEINTPMQYIGDNTNFLKATVGRLIDVAQAAQGATSEGATEEHLAELRKSIERSKLPMLIERAPKAADDALAGVQSVSRIVSAMKRFSHPGSEDAGPVDVNDAIDTTLTVCRNEWKYCAELETDFEENAPPAEGRVGPLNQVWLNLIVNAAHAISDRHGDDLGKITIRTRSTNNGADLEISITDNGSGISEEHLSRVFDHFFTTKDVGVGTGQGLAIAHQVIVAEHNGSISVDSSLGEGTTFTIVLPTVQNAAMAGAR